MIRSEQDGHVALITLDRQERLNALDPDSNNELRELWLKFRADASVRAVVVTGAGTRAFSAGFDLNHAAQGFSLDPPPFAGIVKGLDFFKPVISAVNGLAFGGGLEMVLASDIRYAVPEATFALPETSLGLIAGGGGLVRLTRSLPWPIASDVVFGGRVLDADEAERYGLINAIVEREQLVAHAVEKAHKVAELGPLAVRTSKETMWRSFGMDLDAALRFEERMSYAVQQSDESRELVARFGDRRKQRKAS